MSKHKWHRLYEQAQAESDLPKLHNCVMEAEYAMVERSWQLNDGQNHDGAAHAELAALRQAANGLFKNKN